MTILFLRLFIVNLFVISIVSIQSQANPLTSLYVNQPGGVADILSGADGEYSEIHTILSGLFCGVVPAALLVKFSSIADNIKVNSGYKEELKYWEGNPDMIKHIKSMSRLNPAGKVWDKAIDISNGVLLTVSASVCFARFSDDAIAAILQEPAKEYNLNNNFKKFVEEKGWDSAIETLRSWKGIPFEERIQEIDYKIKSVIPAAKEQVEDFFDNAQFEKISR